MMALTALIVLLSIIQFIAVFQKKTIVKVFNKQVRISLILFISLVFVAFLFVYKLPTATKINTLRKVGITNIYQAKLKITTLIYSYQKILSNDLTYNNVYQQLWKSIHDPKDPGSGWGTRKHNLVYSIQGLNHEIVPKESIGYLMDSTCNSSNWDNNSTSYTLIEKNKVHKGDSIIFTAYCYASEDFNGDWAKINFKGIIEEQVYYDLNQKASWQKLEIKTKATAEGNVSGFLYWAKLNTINFKNLKGYVVYAHPTITILKHDTSKTTLISNKENNAPQKYKSTPLCKNSILDGIALLNFINVQDPIGRLKNNFVKSDTAYKPYSFDFEINTLNNGTIARRVYRWQFALQIFQKEYNWRKKLFGGGFDYLNWYGYYFYNDKTKSDWPHNPFLSVLLYSGILGLSLYLVLMYKVCYYYIKYRKEYGIFFIFFLITFFFSFFSANGPFDPPVMGFFVLLPFFIHYIHQKEAKEESLKYE